MTNNKHRHEVIREIGPWGFTGPVNPWAENRAAHGNVGYTEKCSCGAERLYLVNQSHYEIGEWREGDEQRRSRLAREGCARDERARRDRAAGLVRRARDVLPSRRLVDVARGIRLDITGLDVDDLLRDDAEVEVIVDWPVSYRAWCTLGELRQAAREWSDDPESPAGRVYCAIGDALPAKEVA